MDFPFPWMLTHTGDTGHRQRTASGSACILGLFGEWLNPPLDLLESELTA